MRNYQLVLVLRPSIAEAQRKKLLDTVKDWVKEAKFVKEEIWGQKQLSYKISRETEGFYVNWLFEMETVPADFEKKILAQENVIRHLLVRNEEKKVKSKKEIKPKKEESKKEEPKKEEKPKKETKKK